jgi:galactokinase
MAEGLSLSVAVDRHLSLAAAPRTDGRIELLHPLMPDGHAFWLSDLHQEPELEWSRPVKAVLKALKHCGVHFSGFSAAIHDGIPAGLGSRAALRCATALLVREMFPFTLTDSGLGTPPRRDPRTQRLPELDDAERRQLAKLCREASLQESPNGEDHFTPLFARVWQALVTDWQSGSVERWPFAGTAVVLCEIKDDSTNQPSMAEFRNSLLAATNKLGVRSLRSVEPAFLRANSVRLNAAETSAVSQLVSENHWIVRGEAALREGDHRLLGQFLLLSHDGTRDALQTTSPEAESLVRKAREHPACLGSRALFETSRIATVSLASYHEVESFAAHLAAEGERCLGRTVTVLVLPVADGAN